MSGIEEINESGYTCCFTGHRRIVDKHMRQMPEVLSEIVELLISRGVTAFRAGGAIGFDMVAALVVLQKKDKYPNIRLSLYLPCRDQSDRWGETDTKAYKYILSMADEIIYIRDKYSRGCMLERNRRMIDGSDFCIGYCISEKGGSAYSLNYAQKKGLRVTNIAALMKAEE